MLSQINARLYMEMGERDNGWTICMDGVCTVPSRTIQVNDSRMASAILRLVHEGTSGSNRYDIFQSLGQQWEWKAAKVEQMAGRPHLAMLIDYSVKGDTVRSE